MIRYIYPSGNETTEEDRKFSVNELKRIYNDHWYTLCFAYDVKNEDGTFTDYYLCRLDTHKLKIEELPEFNEYATQLFGREAYGVVIVAPSTLFC